MTIYLMVMTTSTQPRTRNHTIVTTAAARLGSICPIVEFETRTRRQRGWELHGTLHSSAAHTRVGETAAWRGDLGDEPPSPSRGEG